MRIGIDAGHGKDGDPGGVGPSGLKEADVTQSLAVELGNLILALGHDVFLCDRSLYASERAVQASKAGCDVLISLHTNSGSASAQGIEAWFAHGNEEGKRLAGAILGVLISETGAVSRGIKDDADWHPASDPNWTGGMGVLRYFPGPAVLLELLFISNPQEEELLRSGEYLKKCAHAIALGLLDFINSWKGRSRADPGKGEREELPGFKDPGSGGSSGSPEDLLSGEDSGGGSSPSRLDPFPDLSPTLWEGKARRIVLALYDLGIITGYEDGTFRPDQPITRMEAVSLVYRALNYLGKVPAL
ncbi:MAG: N-acetylmuramoyl-L-alanine amidase [Caldiserica bacterium]|jgi:N-acetylmuramoyl-L-alanine amidase|nr:N-acetylmuramoyl-L-alanine amidase [Caldisericota bacterium]